MPTARTIAEILEYHRRSEIALLTLDRAFEALPLKESTLFPRLKPAFLEVLEEMRDELDDEVVLTMIAAAERVLRLDFTERLADNDAQAVRFNALDKKYDGRVPLEEVLDVWKDLAKAPDEVGRFKQLYKYRHGLAHGRYFNKSGLHDATPDDVDVIVSELWLVIRAIASDFPRS